VPRTAVRCGLLVAIFLVVVVLPSDAVADRAFGPRFTVSTQGAITIAANSIMTCLDDQGGVCARARNAVGGAIPANNNNARAMTWIDVDGDPATFDSSSAELSLPAGASVLFAGLYYGGRLAAGQGGSPPPNPSARNTVLFKSPGATDYQLLTASQVDDASTQYQGFVNVTGIVDAAGAGTYTTANVQLGTGLSDSTSGGWALVVAYGDPAAPSRNLSVFDGLQNVGSASTVVIPLSGFQTPLSGAVNSTVGIVAYEGDLGTTGDGAQLQGPTGSFSPLTNTVNPQNNVFNSTISSAGTFVTSRTPSYQNNLGYDADLFTTTPGMLGNGQTSTQVRLSTSGDAYQPGVVTIATDLYAPRITATKTVNSATANLGDTLTYTVNVQNDGSPTTDAAIDTRFSDLIPAGAVFVPGSITLGGVPLTDASGDDLGEFAGGQVVVRLGTGATAGAGGTLAPGASATVSFRVTVATAGLLLGATVENTADLAFRAATTGVPSTVTTAPATTIVNVPDLAIGKTHSPALSPGLPSTYTITVGNVGAGPTSGTVTVTDTIEPPGLTIRVPPGVTGAGWSCSTLVSTVTCTRSDALAAGSDYPPISIPVLVSQSVPPAELSNTATLQAPSDGNADNNSFTDAGAVSEPAIDLHVEKVVTSTPGLTPAGYVSGDTITYRIEVTNNGVADAANVQLGDTLEAPLILQSMTPLPPSQATCTGTVCNLGTITPDQAPVVIDVQAAVPNGFENYPSNRLLSNTATVSAPIGTEINPDDNSAAATINTLPIADISATKTFSPAEPVVGGPVTYTLTVHNHGPDTVQAGVADLLPEAFQKPPTSISISGGTGVCQYDPTGELAGAPPGSNFPITWCDIPQFAPGEDRVITYESTLAPNSAGTPVTNNAFGAALVPLTIFVWDPDNFADNFAAVTFTPGTVDVGMTKSVVGSSTIAVGDVATFRLVASSSGTVAATNVAVTDTLPDGLTLVDAPPACTSSGQTVTCAAGTLAPGAEQTFDLQVRTELAAAGKTLTNGARVSTADPDLASADNSASANLTVGPAPAPREVDLAVTVRGPTAVVREGGVATFRLNVTNRGPAAATSVVLNGTAQRSVSDSFALQQTCTGLPLHCEVGTLAPGAQRTFTVSVRRLRLGQVSVRGTVTAAEPETTVANNVDRASVRIRMGRALVSFTKRAGTTTAQSGDPVSFSMVIRNTGSIPARGVVVCDRLPSGLTWERLGGARLRDGQACWTVRRLAGGRTARYHIVTRTTSVTRVRRVTNTAIVRGTNLAKRAAGARVTVRPAATPRPPFTG
jgi:uncharacterized repeat protein (TIGR01451 family)